MQNAPQPSKLNIAAIDIGTNSAHLVVAQCDQSGTLKILDEDKISLRLGDELGSSKTFSKACIQKVVNTISHMKTLSKTYDPIFRAVATHATRVARNHRQLIEAIQKQTNIDVSIIDGVEEARLTSLGVMYGLNLGEDPFLVVDIGGGSTEFIVRDRYKVYFVTSLQIGAVTFTKKYNLGQNPKKDDLQEMLQALSVSLGPVLNDLKKIHFKSAIISSGTAKALANLDLESHLQNKKQTLNGYTLTTPKLHNIHAKLKNLLKPSKIQEALHLDQNRSEIILAGCSILKQISDGLDVKKWVVSSFSLREGLVIDTFTRLYSDHHLPFFDENIRWQKILQFGRDYHVEEIYANQVMTTALEIYDQLIELCQEFNFDQNSFLSSREILKAAAWLHECGKYVNHSHYHRHSNYLIVHGRILGLSQKEQMLIGLIVRFHRKGKPTLKAHEFREVPASEMKRIEVLSAILRFACAAHRTRLCFIQHVHVQATGKRLVFTIHSHKSADVDIAKIMQEKNVISNLLGRDIDVRIAG